MKTKTDTAMGLPERLILEFVCDRPGHDATEVARALSMYDETTKDAVTALMKGGFLNRARYQNRRLPLVWTGKAFPASVDFEIPKGCSTSHRSKLQSLLMAKARREAMLVTCEGMRAMLQIGRVMT
ncbi:hypothetical protein [Burkholderia contaminans]|uniref:hypothetical protein n=1 Tax=Burkholderia contaminans TaxID=488447 RepID=UPI001453C862|nr:hypothetical protein [Burkholderia contaminans]VWD22277.1 hypothetical protein BCO18442_04009 [Burkholderia contaminans]